MSSDEENEAEASRIFTQRSNLEFNHEFLGRKSVKKIENDKKIRDMTLELNKAREEVDEYRQKAEEYGSRLKEINKKEHESELAIKLLKEELGRLRDVEKNYDGLKEDYGKIMREKKENEILRKKIAELDEQIKDLKNRNTIELDKSMKAPEPRVLTPTEEQTLTEPSVLLCHLKNNPFSLAVKEFQENEAKKRKLDSVGSEVDCQKLLEAAEEIQKLKQEITKLMEQRERAATFTAESARRYREIVRFITGYDIKMRNEEYIEVSSVYDPSNQFSFQRIGKEMNVLDNEYARNWIHLMQTYLPGSLPSFMSATTIELYMKQAKNPQKKK
ncbi:hypothetical protein FO519_002267 [Halicephalobus sp. NKZ332]|nr:hypothetical protein FO519_002267 [Halicephalobus sp. NKZ332]